MLERWKKLSSEDRFKNPWWTYRFDRFALPNGKEGEYHSVHTGGAAMTVPVADDGRVLLLRQYRFLIDEESLEFPAGGMKDGEDAATIARKELIEEAGFDGVFEKVGRFTPFNGISDETCHVFIARNLKPSAEHRKDDTEAFEEVWMTPAELDAAIAENRVTDGMTMAGWSLAKPRLGR